MLKCVKRYIRATQQAKPLAKLIWEPCITPSRIVILF